MFKSAFQEDYDDGAKAYFAKESNNPHANPARAETCNVATTTRKRKTRPTKPNGKLGKPPAAPNSPAPATWAHDSEKRCVRPTDGR